ncbi:Re/Si-specific NAD(P)(+) transhydrogenase subunit alpha [Candidatus Sumerlaeota bacterium]|nr:Re/Si-specific NAD(P)(+) transhydrogenase subunit alpha [Candidatus Sumerlaeota bacterium]
MIIGVTKETFPAEQRVALVPAALLPLTRLGLEIQIEAEAGLAAGYTDAEYEAKGAKVLKTRDTVLKNADILLQVRGYGANSDKGKTELKKYRKDQIIIAQQDPLSSAALMQELAETGAKAFGLELIPRITRAQSMDVLSSMATIAGYKAVLLAANKLPKMFPMMMTAAGTIAPAKVFVIGAGVAGLQAIASSKRLGAVVQAYDVRPAVKEQIESLGGRFVEMKDLDTSDAQDKGGYAKEMGDEQIRKQRELMMSVVKDMDVVITTAAIPGKKAPLLVTRDMVEAMAPGSVIVDLAAERGGNCELSMSGEEVVHHNVTIIGPENIPAMIPFHASQMYARNITTFLQNMLTKEGELNINMEDEIIRDTLICEGGEVVNARIKELQA